MTIHQEKIYLSEAKAKFPKLILNEADDFVMPTSSGKPNAQTQTKATTINTNNNNNQDSNVAFLNPEVENLIKQNRWQEAYATAKNSTFWTASITNFGNLDKGSIAIINKLAALNKLTVNLSSDPITISGHDKNVLLDSIEQLKGNKQLQNTNTKQEIINRNANVNFGAPIMKDLLADITWRFMQEKNMTNAIDSNDQKSKDVINAWFDQLGFISSSNPFIKFLNEYSSENKRPITYAGLVALNNGLDNIYTDNDLNGNNRAVYALTRMSSLYYNNKTQEDISNIIASAANLNKKNRQSMSEVNAGQETIKIFVTGTNNVKTWNDLQRDSNLKPTVSRSHNVDEVVAAFKNLNDTEQVTARQQMDKTSE